MSVAQEALSPSAGVTNGRRDAPLAGNGRVNWRPALRRAVAACVGVLPDFLVIGAQRGGTTSLYDHLRYHPDIVSAAKKEVHFFDLNYGRGTAWYRSHFPFWMTRIYSRRLRRRPFVTGEASPYYLFHPHAARRAARLVPDAKLIVMLRNPIDRAYSHHQFSLKNGKESLSFEEAIDCEAERLRGETERLLEDERYYSYAHQHQSYLTRGLYANQLKMWGRYFASRQMLVVQSERFYEDPGAVLQQVLGFLGLSRWELAKYPRRNVGRYEAMEPALRARLRAHFWPHNRRLFALLGTTFDWDDDPQPTEAR